MDRRGNTREDLPSQHVETKRVLWTDLTIQEKTFLHNLSRQKGHCGQTWQYKRKPSFTTCRDKKAIVDRLGNTRENLPSQDVETKRVLWTDLTIQEKTFLHNLSRQKGHCGQTWQYKRKPSFTTCRDKKGIVDRLGNTRENLPSQDVETKRVLWTDLAIQGKRAIHVESKHLKLCVLCSLARLCLS